MTRDDVLTYIDHFNNRRYEAFAAYYHPEVEVDYGYTIVRGPQGIIDFYKDFHQYFRETLEVRDLLIDGDKICAEYPSTFECIKDNDRLAAGPMKVGDVVVSTNFIIYHLEDDKFRSIRIGRYKTERR